MIELKSFVYACISELIVKVFMSCISSHTQNISITHRIFEDVFIRNHSMKAFAHDIAVLT